MATKSTPLNDWLIQNDIDRAAFAKRLGVSNAAVGRYCIGERIPEREVMVKIMKLTKGEVDANSFFTRVSRVA
jgi:transcriptional regulator with XRE-family HTH domain